MAVSEALVAALLFAAGSALQHRSSSAGAQIRGLSPGALISFGRTVLQNPAWVLALGVEGVGVCFHAAALHEGTLVLVQPLLVTTLVFALPLRRRLDRGAVAAPEVAWALVLVAGLAIFLVSATPAWGSAQRADTGPAVGLSVGGVLVVVGASVLARKRRGTARALLLGVAAGVAFAGTAALIKTAGDLLASNGLVALFAGWPLWAVLAAGATGVLLNQLAFQAGPLSASLPAIQTVNPVLSVLLGVVVYDEQLRHGALALAAEAVGLSAALLASAVLSRGGGGLSWRPLGLGGMPAGQAPPAEAQTGTRAGGDLSPGPPRGEAAAGPQREPGQESGG